MMQVARCPVEVFGEHEENIRFRRGGEILGHPSVNVERNVVYCYIFPKIRASLNGRVATFSRC